MSSERVRLLFGLMVALLGVVAGACVVGDGVEGPSEYGDAPLTNLIGEALELLDEKSALESEFFSACMRGKGFAIPPVANARRGGDAYVPFEAPPLTVERARTYGYRWTPEDGDAGQQVEQDFQQYLNGLSDSEIESYEYAAIGSGRTIQIETEAGFLELPAEGCYGTSGKAVAGSLEAGARWDALVNMLGSLRSEAFALADQDGDVRAAGERWHECMAENGYGQFFAPVEASDWAAVHLSTGDGGDLAMGPSVEEIELAVIDATCRDDSGLAAILPVRRSHYESVVLARNEAVLFEWREAAKELRRALEAIPES